MSSIPIFGGISGVPISTLAPQADQVIRLATSTLEDKKIDKSASDFESILLGSWLEQAEKSFGSLPGTDDDDSDSGAEQLQGIAMQSLGTAMTSAGGIGIAKMISTSLHRAEDKSEAKAASDGPSK